VKKYIFFGSINLNLFIYFVKSDQESAIKRATMLSEVHFKKLRQKLLLVKRTQELAQQIEV
jgi:hypothetical protein